MPADDVSTRDARAPEPARTRAPPAGESRLRSIAKAVSWRVVGSLDTLLLSYLFTGSVLVAGSIASTETVTKTVLYYLHERGWGLIPLGRA
ncbi:Uncharacterized membrane protein [Methylobacterium sp. 275MFSha3.1]|uniref:DUF2061 domain-containing protein n=1 Tax=Methylobacterium sp. 275MFSha3.1 TaxID=1502746 RepID=UPI0008A79C82|nr:DUF2061 domain-containing protein [Methylobacterium sp. 275MFSha3.1]SEH43342.1 Uncharacterized membrane protein [Methylobacterium sp. 275MFSha3.1]